MSKVVKTISIGLIAVAAIAVIAFWFLVSNLDAIVKQVVEQVGTETLDTQVTLSSAEISLAEASAALRGLRIANPDGFSAQNAFELGAIEVALAPESLSTEVMVLETIAIDSASLLFEQQGARNNLQTLLDKLDSGGGDAESAADDEESNQMIIREFRFTRANVRLSHDQLDSDIDLTLPDIVLRNIGNSDQAVTPEEAARQIIEPILTEAQDAAKRRAEEELREIANQEMEKQKDRAIKKLNEKLFGE